MRTRMFWCGAAVAAAVLAGCSSAGSGSSAPGAAQSPGSAALATARANITAALHLPATIPITTPLTSRPPAGKTIIYLQCEVAQCALEGDGLQSAAAALGWTYKTLGFQAANPSTLLTAMNTALQYHPLAVFFSGVPYSLWQNEIPKYQAAGTYIVPSSVPGLTPGPTVITSLGADALYQQAGKLLADEVAAYSGGTGKVLLATVPTYTIFGPLQTSYTAELKAVCPGCSSQTFDATIPEVTSNGMVPAIVSALKRSPGTGYVVSVDGDFVQTLPSALASAGLAGKVQILTFSGTSAVQQLVKAGQIETTTGYGYSYEAWLGVDAVLRAMQKLPISGEHETLPMPLLTKATVPAPTNSDDVPADYQAQFKKLWLLG